MRRMFLRHVRTLALAVTLLFALPALVASADAPPGPYFNGFETNTAGWFNFEGATVTRVPSGSPSTYATGISAATGNYFARLGIGNNVTCQSGAGTLDWYVGPYTNWGGESSIFPPGGYQTGVDVYLDVGWAATHPDRRFDWSSAINEPSGNFRREFVFNVGTEPATDLTGPGFYISAGNNSTRCGAYPENPGNLPIKITTSGWYTFGHAFTGVAGGPLTVDMTVKNSTGTPLGTWVRSDPTDIIGSTVGGNAYGWFVQNEIDELAIDNSFRTGAISTPLCTANITNGGWIIAKNRDKASFGGNAKVDSAGNTSGQEEYQDHGPARQITVNSIAVSSVYCTEDRTKATILGTATVNGSGTYQYEIDLTDKGQSGANDMYRMYIPGIGYDSGNQTLGGGNITIH
ncbi:MAG TPA: post-COAP-1 domain-containing protein [Solirubrobacteraceae bacterium]|nr:post-COAP-1 domain-containing protein [Solirubrobacteraceae bacterium]